MASGQQTETRSRRSEVTVGPLPDDFLRIEPDHQQLEQSASLPIGGQQQHHLQQQQQVVYPGYGRQMAYQPPNVYDFTSV